MNFGKKGIKEKYKSIHSTPKKSGTKILLTVVKAIIVCILFVGITVAFAGLGFIKGIIDTAPEASSIDLSPTGYATKVYDSTGNEIESLVQSGSNRVYASLDEIPRHLIYAFVDIEDQRFFEHNGIDIRGIFRAGLHGLESGEFDQGASTLTQQLIKNKLFNSGMGESTFMHSLKRKIQEQYLALELEKVYNKNDILEAYLNMINLGSGTLGVQSASRKYFNKDVWELTLSESAVIAAITQNPSGLDPIYYPEANANRRKLILNNMLEFGHITSEQYNEALEDDVYARIQNISIEFGSGKVYSYFVDEIIKQVLNDLKAIGYTSTEANYLLYSGGLSIYTTMDSEIQKICDEEFANPANFPKNVEYSISWQLTVEHEDGTKQNYSERQIEAYFKYGDSAHGVKANSFFKLIFSSPEEADEYIETYKKNKLTDTDKIIGERIYYTPQPQASFIIIDQSTGYVRALVGGRGEKLASRTQNRATSTLRQAGSTFKIISTYAPGINEGLITLASVQYDESGYKSADGASFRNYDNKYAGFMSVRLAIANSVNVVAVKVLNEITPKLGFDYVRKFGISTLVESEYLNGAWRSDLGLSLALGGLTKGVSNLELTAAYAAIANDGVYQEPIFYTKILDHSGNVILDRTKSQESHRVITSDTADLMTNAMQDVVKYGSGTATRLKNMDSAGKTGTTSDYNDIWYVGYTPYYTAGIWSGYDENKSQTKAATGNSNAANYHKNLWAAIMSRVHENLQYKSFKVPNTFVKVEVCSKSGKLAIPGVCDNTIEGNCITTEYFTPDTIPTEYCDNHIIVEMCGISGKIACPECPRDTIWGMVYIDNVNITPTTDEEGNIIIGQSKESSIILPLDLTTAYCPVHYTGPVTQPATPIPDDDNTDKPTDDDDISVDYLSTAPSPADELSSSEDETKKEHETGESTCGNEETSDNNYDNGSDNAAAPKTRYDKPSLWDLFS